MYNLTDGMIKSLYRLIKKKIPTKVSQLQNDSGFKTTDTTYSNATQAKSGLMSYSDKKKLDGIATGATNTAAVPSGLTSGYVRTGVKSGTTVGNYSSATGTNNTPSGAWSECGGYDNTVLGQCAHAEGRGNTVSGNYGHVEGYQCSTGEKPYCHAEGEKTQANGQCSHSGGCNTIANGCCQTVIGHWNQAFGTEVSVDTMFIIGGGDNSESGRYNSFRVTKAGNVMGRSSYQSSGADYAEFFEWTDYNMKDEDRRGYFVTLEGKKIRIATSDDSYILGIVSSSPVVLGNESSDEWCGKFKKDEFGEYVKKQVVERMFVGVNENGEKEYVDVTYEALIVSPDYNPEKEDMYVPRSERQEWSPIGLLGQLIVRDDSTCLVDHNCVVSDAGIATLSDDDNKGWRVIERINDHLVRVLFR